MAISAETTQFELLPDLTALEALPSLYLFEDSLGQKDNQSQQFPTLIDADTIPELRFTRQMAARQASEILARNRQLLREGEFENVPIPVDPLGTARRVVELKTKYGVDSPEYRDSFAGLVLDSERLIGETFRKNTWEYFGLTTQQLDPVTDLYLSHGIPILDITERGLSPIAEPEDLNRRINDHVAEHANHAVRRIKALGRLGIRETVRVRGISECADWAIEAYSSDQKASHGGYVPAIEKLMIGDLVFGESNDRQQEQIGISGRYITHEVITTVLERQGAIAEGQALSKTELHSKQFIDQTNGIVGFVELLDQEASKVSGKNIFMGEEVSDEHHKDYGKVVEEAEDRRRKLAPKPLQLAEHLVELEENGTDRWAAEALVSDYLKTLLLEVVRHNPEQAEIVFDKATADGLAEVAWLRDQGQYELAAEKLQKVEHNAPPPSYCGAGSCGLEAASPISQDAKIAKSLGLNGELIHDTERSCINCKAKKVYYDTKGNKACTSCGYHQVNGKISSNKPSKLAA